MMISTLHYFPTTEQYNYKKICTVSLPYILRDRHDVQLVYHLANAGEVLKDD